MFNWIFGIKSNHRVHFNSLSWSSCSSSPPRPTPSWLLTGKSWQHKTWNEAEFHEKVVGWWCHWNYSQLWVPKHVFKASFFGTLFIHLISCNILCMPTKGNFTHHLLCNQIQINYVLLTMVQSGHVSIFSCLVHIVTNWECKPIDWVWYKM